MLLCRTLHRLSTLILNNCELNAADDLRSLALASAKGEASLAGTLGCV